MFHCYFFKFLLFAFYLEQLQAQWGGKAENEKSLCDLHQMCMSFAGLPSGCYSLSPSLFCAFSISKVPALLVVQSHPTQDLSVTKPMYLSLDVPGHLPLSHICLEWKCPTRGAASSSHLRFSVTHLLAQGKNFRGLFEGPFFLNLK